MQLCGTAMYGRDGRHSEDPEVRRAEAELRKAAKAVEEAEQELDDVLRARHIAVQKQDDSMRGHGDAALGASPLDALEQALRHGATVLASVAGGEDCKCATLDRQIRAVVSRSTRRQFEVDKRTLACRHDPRRKIL